MFQNFLQNFLPDQQLFPVVCLFLISILYFVWKSTQVRDIPVATIPFGNFAVRRSSSIVSNTSTVSAASTTEENLAESSVENITDQILAEAYRNNENSTETNDITEEEEIIREMDRDLPTSSGESSLRRRVTDEPNGDDRISIKLKYINDEIKIVNGFLHESVGSFKRRQFDSEILNSKLVKLIFNGQILGDDEKSLSQYGLFSDAVIHCLILQKRNVINPVQSPPQNNHTANSFLSSTLEWNGTFFIYILGMVLVSLTLIACWYARIQYSSYFSWYSTLGLILMTSLFLVMVPLLTLVGFFHNQNRS